jgi:hypothetical protein
MGSESDGLRTSRRAHHGGATAASRGARHDRPTARAPPQLRPPHRPAAGRRRARLPRPPRRDTPRRAGPRRHRAGDRGLRGHLLPAGLGVRPRLRPPHHRPEAWPPSTRSGAWATNLGTCATSFRHTSTSTTSEACRTFPGRECTCTPSSCTRPSPVMGSWRAPGTGPRCGHTARGGRDVCRRGRVVVRLPRGCAPCGACPPRSSSSGCRVTPWAICGVAVDTGSGWFLHAGDAYFDRARSTSPGGNVRLEWACSSGSSPPTTASGAAARTSCAGSSPTIRRSPSSPLTIPALLRPAPYLGPGPIDRGRSGAAHVPEPS